MYDVIVIGSGPAGMAAAIYAASSKLKALVVSRDIPTYPNLSAMSSWTFENLKQEFESVQKSKNLELQLNKKIVALEKNIVSFSVELTSGAVFYSKTVIIACGHDRHSLEGNADFETLTSKDATGKIKVAADMGTNVPGLFAAGGITVTGVADIFSSAGEGARAALSVVAFLNKK